MLHKHGVAVPVADIRRLGTHDGRAPPAEARRPCRRARDLADARHRPRRVACRARGAGLRPHAGRADDRVLPAGGLSAATPRPACTTARPARAAIRRSATAEKGRSSSPAWSDELVDGLAAALRDERMSGILRRHRGRLRLCRRHRGHRRAMTPAPACCSWRSSPDPGGISVCSAGGVRSRETAGTRRSPI